MNVIDAVQLAVLFAFTVINGAQIGGLIMASRTMLLRDRRVSTLEATVMTRASTYLPVSFIVPAYNEQETIVSSVRSLLAMHYPEFEVIVANDGSTDDMLARLQEAFALRPIAPNPHRFTQHAPVKGAYRSRSNPNFVVVDKENGGRADALNAAMEQARYPLVVAIDADSLVDPGALQLAGTRFLDDPRLMGLGGSIRLVNEAEVSDGTVRAAHTPRNFLARWQHLEYVRAFTVARAAMSQIGCLTLISGAFGVFRRSALIAVGGYRVDTVGEDFELTVRLHRYFRDRGETYRIQYLMDAVCWTQVPEEAAVLRSQRDRWHRGLWETLWAHKDMLFNPRYGRIGWLAFPYFFILEGLGPVIEFIAYLYFFYMLFVMEPGSLLFMTTFFLVAFVLGIALSLVSICLEELSFKRYPKLSDLLQLFLLSVIESFGYRQLNAWWRIQGVYTFLTGNKEWGKMERKGFNTPK